MILRSHERTIIEGFFTRKRSKKQEKFSRVCEYFDKFSSPKRLQFDYSVTIKIARLSNGHLVC